MSKHFFREKPGVWENLILPHVRIDCLLITWRLLKLISSLYIHIQKYSAFQKNCLVFGFHVQNIVVVLAIRCKVEYHTITNMLPVYILFCHFLGNSFFDIWCLNKIPLQCCLPENILLTVTYHRICAIFLSDSSWARCKHKLSQPLHQEKVAFIKGQGHWQIKVHQCWYSFAAEYNEANWGKLNCPSFKSEPCPVWGSNSRPKSPESNTLTTRPRPLLF